MYAKTKMTRTTKLDTIIPYKRRYVELERRLKRLRDEKSTIPRKYVKGFAYFSILSPSLWAWIQVFAHQWNKSWAIMAAILTLAFFVSCIIEEN